MFKPVKYAQNTFKISQKQRTKHAQNMFISICSHYVGYFNFLSLSESSISEFVTVSIKHVCFKVTALRPLSHRKN